jgi:hypothetical protein
VPFHIFKIIYFLQEKVEGLWGHLTDDNLTMFVCICTCCVHVGRWSWRGCECPISAFKKYLIFTKLGTTTLSGVVFNFSKFLIISCMARALRKQTSRGGEGGVTITRGESKKNLSRTRYTNLCTCAVNPVTAVATNNEVGCSARPVVTNTHVYSQHERTWKMQAALPPYDTSDCANNLFVACDACSCVSTIQRNLLLSWQDKMNNRLSLLCR